MSLTIEQIKNKKSILQKKILNIIKEFEKETETYVNKISFDIGTLDKKRFIQLDIDSGI